MTAGIFNLEGDEYWSDPRKNQLAALRRARRHGLFIDAPARVDLRRHRSIPLLLAYCDVRRHAFAVRLGNEAKLVATRLDDRAVLLGDLAIHRPGLPESWASSEQPTSSVHVLDAAAQLGISDQGGTYVLRVVMREWSSNAVVVRVEPASPLGRGTPAIQPAPWPETDGDRLALPEGIGIVLAMREAPDEGLCVGGGLCLPLLPGEVGSESERELTRTDAKPGRAMAGVSIVVIAGAAAPLRGEQTVPAWGFALEVPVSEIVPGEEGGAPLGRGHFLFDLSRRVPAAAASGPLYVHAFGGAAAAEPLRLGSPWPARG